MTKIFIDTNYFLRFLIKGNRAQQNKVEQLFFQAVENKVELFTNLIVMFEIYWVMTSFYQKNKRQVIEILDQVMSLDFIRLENKEIFQQACELFDHSNLELEDCYHLLYAQHQQANSIGSFDKKLQKQAKKLGLK